MPAHTMLRKISLTIYQSKIVCPSLEHHIKIRVTKTSTTMTSRRRRPQRQSAMLQSLVLLLFLPIVSSFTSSTARYSHSSSLLVLFESTEASAPSKEDSTYFQIPDPSTVPRSTSQRITLTRYLNNVVKERPEVCVCVL